MEADTLTVLINRSGGAARSAGDALSGQVRSAFSEQGETVDIVLLDGAEMASAIRDRSSRERRLIVAGGDGTISCAAGVLAGTDTELAILPLGTLNHLARDAGIPSDLAAAAALAVHGTAHRIDTGRVGTRCFVNNASIGIYPAMVKERESLQEQGQSKRRASLPAAWRAFSGSRDMHLRIDTGHGPRPLVTPILFIGNNRYEVTAGSVGRRASLDKGELCVFSVRQQRRRLALAWFALRALFGRSDRARDFVAEASCTEIRVAGDYRELDIALDGEVDRLPLPLQFTIWPKSLNLVMDPAL